MMCNEGRRIQAHRRHCCGCRALVRSVSEPGTAETTAEVDVSERDGVMSTRHVAEFRPRSPFRIRVRLPETPASTDHLFPSARSSSLLASSARRCEGASSEQSRPRVIVGEVGRRQEDQSAVIVVVVQHQPPEQPGFVLRFALGRRQPRVVVVVIRKALGRAQEASAAGVRRARRWREQHWERRRGVRLHADTMSRRALLYAGPGFLSASPEPSTLPTPSSLVVRVAA